MEMCTRTRTIVDGSLRWRSFLEYVRFILVLLLALIGSYSAWIQGAKAEILQPGMVNPGHEEQPQWFKHSFLDIREDIAEAKAQNKRLIIYLYQDGCPYCKKLLQDNFGQRDISRKTQQYFDLIAINMWGDREVVDLSGAQTTEKRFAKALKVMFTPTLLMLDEAGKVVLRINGYYPPHRFLAALEYVGARRGDSSGFQDYLTRLAPQSSSAQLHSDAGFLKAPYRFADQIARSTKPLLILLEQKSCAACDELHLDILARKESQVLLSAFDVALLDMWSRESVQTPTGKEIPIEQWVRELDVKYTPTMIFFDRKGQEVFRTEAFLRSFHIQSVLDYVASGAYLEEPEFQRYIERRADGLRAQGIEVNLMN